MFFWAERSVNGIWTNLMGESLFAVPGAGVPHSPDAVSRQYVLPTGGDVAFSAYGPLVTLPSGRIMQTAYGIAADGSSRIRVLMYDNWADSWTEKVVVDSHSFRPTEAAVVSLGGKSDAVARLLMVARTEYVMNGSLRGALRQYVSDNGGKTWIDRGEIPASVSSGQVMPWIARLGD